MKKESCIYLIALIFMLILSSCKNYHDEMLDWSSRIPVGSDIETVKKDQPEFLEIDWYNPDTLDNGMTRFYITEIKRNDIILKMEYFLEFKNNSFRGFFGHK